ncbi:MAG: MFS transporter [Peptococcaceae bacterium]|nr:MFS transporter [Peptococcaceae bacterium]
MTKNTLRCFSIVGYSFILMFLMQTIVGSLHSLFLVPVTEGLGMERSAFSLMFTISGLSGVASLPVVTKLLQKYPARIVVSVSILMSGGGFAMFSQATELWQFFAIAVVMGAGNSGCTLMVASLLINNWFEDRKGLALGIGLTGSGFGAALLSPVVTHLITVYGWRTAYLLCGIVMLAVCIPLTLLLAAVSPAEKNARPYRDGSGKETENTTEISKPEGPELKAIRGKGFFWMFLIGMAGWSFAIGGIHSHFPAYLTDVGHTAQFVAMVYSVEAVSLIIGKIAAGMIFDAKGSKAGLLFMAGTFALGLVLLLMAEQPVLAVLFAVSYGCGISFSSVGIPSLIGGFFGQKSYADILGIVNMAYILGASFGPFVSGMAFDALGSYRIIWMVYLVLFSVSAVLLWLVKSHLDKRYNSLWFCSEMQE